jgi:hypothetical protein
MSNLAGVNWRLGRAQSWSSRSPRRSVPSRGGGGGNGRGSGGGGGGVVIICNIPKFNPKVRNPNLLTPLHFSLDSTS